MRYSSLIFVATALLASLSACDQTPDSKYCEPSMFGPPPMIGVTRSALAGPGTDPPPPADHDDYVPPTGVCVAEAAGGQRTVYGDTRLHDCGADFVNPCDGTTTAAVSFYYRPPSDLPDGYCFFSAAGGTLGGTSTVSVQLGHNEVGSEKPYYTLAAQEDGSQQVFLVTDGVHISPQGGKYQNSQGYVSVLYRFDGTQTVLEATDLRVVCLEPQQALRYAVEVGAKLLF